MMSCWHQSAEAREDQNLESEVQGSADKRHLPGAEALPGAWFLAARNLLTRVEGLDKEDRRIPFSARPESLVSRLGILIFSLHQVILAIRGSKTLTILSAGSGRVHKMGKNSPEKRRLTSESAPAPLSKVPDRGTPH